MADGTQRAFTSTILIADDDVLVRDTYKYAFEQAGHRVFVADGGRRAVQRVTEHIIDTVILDVYMPDEDGIETLLNIRRISPQTKIIMMTGGGARGCYDFLETAMKLGATGVVRKPISPRQLITMIETNTVPVQI